jgi:hypothetical protein
MAHRALLNSKAKAQQEYEYQTEDGARVGARATATGVEA